MNRIHKKSKVALIAEDDEDYFFLIKEVFEKLGSAIALRRVSNGEALMDYLLRPSSQADIILLDLNMPLKDGREALKEIKAHPELRKIPVVVLATSTDSDDVAASYALGANSFVRKPLGFHQWMALAKTFEQYWLETVELPDDPDNGNH